MACDDCKIEDRVRALEMRDAVTQTHYASIVALLAKLETAIEDLKGKPGKRWESVVEKVLMLILAGIVGAVMAQAGIT